MKLSFLPYIVGIVFLGALALPQVASAQTDSLFQRLSVSSAPLMTFRGTEPMLVFQPSTMRHQPTIFASSTPSGLTIPSEPRLHGNLLERTGRYGGKRICSDFRNFYNCDTALNYGVALAGAALLANTSLDRQIIEWYQKDVRSSGTDDFAKFWKFFGEGQIWIPIFATAAISYRLYEQSDWNRGNERCAFGEYAARTTRGYLVGAPSLLVFQNLLGSERPAHGNEKGSYWRPFHKDHGVSGHSFIGAMPFITAAQMTEKPWLKGVFYACSVLPAWSRVNDNAHYLSQAALGWYLAYLSARAVSLTEGTKLPKGLTIFPITEGPHVGVGILYRR